VPQCRPHRLLPLLGRDGGLRHIEFLRTFRGGSSCPPSACTIVACGEIGEKSQGRFFCAPSLTGRRRSNGGSRCGNVHRLGRMGVRNLRVRTCGETCTGTVRWGRVGAEILDAVNAVAWKPDGNICNGDRPANGAGTNVVAYFRDH